mgnify:CR=1 FL=1
MNINFIVDQNNLRFDQFLVSKLNIFSRSKIQNSIKNGDVHLDGKHVKAGTILKGGEIVSGNIVSKNQFASLESQKIPLDIIFEDKHIIILNKQSGIVVHPGNGNQTGTLLNGLLYHFDKLSNINPDKPGIVHRLDKETSGLIIIAKTDSAHQNLAYQFEKRSIKKHYYAISWGKIQESGEIEGYIKRDSKNRTKFAINQNSGRHSITSYLRDEYYTPFSLLHLFPNTGRTHQLRVHLASIGNPIVCDDLYGGGKNKIKSYHSKYSQLCKQIIKTIGRVALHAYKIEIIHPASNQKMKFVAPIPNEFELAINFLKKND